jgi:hypothetical protein
VITCIWVQAVAALLALAFVFMTLAYAEARRK